MRPVNTTGRRPKRSETGPKINCPSAWKIRNTGTIACTSSMRVPRSCVIDQKAGSVMSHEKALTESSSPQ